MKYDVSVIYVYYNTPKEILDSIKSLRSSVGNFTYEIIVVDNASSKPFPKKDTVEKLTLLKNKRNIGYGAGLNRGAAIAKGKYLLLVNPDTLFSPWAVEKMVKRIALNKSIGVLGPQVISTDNTIAQSIAGFPFLPGAIFIFTFLSKIFPRNKFSKKYWLPHLDRSKESFVECLGGVCMLVKKEVFDEVNGFDSQFFMYFEEADFCIRIKTAGYRILYYPEAKIMHLGGQSMKDKEWIKKTFERSRFIFFKKYHSLLYAILGEFFIRFVTPSNFSLLAILLISTFLNLYKINELMMFFGDFGRDYLAARDTILTGEIPLVGIQSSVSWLHQGPLSIYLIVIAFFFSNFHPVSPAIMYGAIGVASTFLVYKLGKLYFNQTVGLLASLFYATSPLVVVNARMPYHTSIIPFLSILVFIFLYKALNKDSKYFPLLFFSIGLLLQVELSNAVVFFILLVLFLFKRPKFSLPVFFKSVIGFILGIIPFALYDMSHGFVQTLGFPIWIINRVRLFFGLTLSGNSTTIHVLDAVNIIWDSIVRIIFPVSEISVAIIIFLLIFNLWNNTKLFISKSIGFSLILLWILVPIFGFMIHTSPGSAYFPLIFVPISLITGYVFYSFVFKIKIFIVFFLLLVIINCQYILKNNYFMSTVNVPVKKVIPNSFYLGLAFSLRDDIARVIVEDAKGKKIKIEAGGFLREYKTGVNNYEYLVWRRGGRLFENASVTYIIYENKDEIPENAHIIYDNKQIYLVKYESG